MIQSKLFVGIDVSKKKLDVCLVDCDHPQGIDKGNFDNTPQGIAKLTNWAKKVSGFQPSRMFFCLEHTGHYAYQLCCFLGEQQLAYTLVPGAQLKKSMGIQRGKNDQVDALIIARYAWLHRQEIRPVNLPEKLILKIKNLLAYRRRLVKSRKSFKLGAKELQECCDKEVYGDIVVESNRIIRSLTLKMEKVEQQIQQLIEGDQKMKRIYDLLISIIGIGPQIAIHTIVATRCFSIFDDPRKFACYSGIAPFEHSSGTSIRGKTRINHQADKLMKSLLSMGAGSALRHDPEIKAYYQRKVAEGKNKRSVRNAIRNKLVSRMFAIVKRQTPYVPLMKHVA